MKITKLALFLSISIIPTFLWAQDVKEAPKNWFNLDYATDSVMGISTEKAYQELLKGRKASPVITAVIDGGVDVHHEDLKDVLWINKKDAKTSGKDADKNGYINDKYGWNFIGNAKGQHIDYDNTEFTRLVRELGPKYEAMLPSTPKTAAEQREFRTYLRAKRTLDQKIAEASYGERNYSALVASVDTIISKVGKKTEAIQLTDLKKIIPANDKEKLALQMSEDGIQEEGSFHDFYTQIKEAEEYYSSKIAYHLNVAYDTRAVVGDHYELASERYYGNADVAGPDAEHGTHVAGIIGANRKNSLGIKGVADAVQIMSLRVVPDGDERDKDVANAIRYAAENGAKVINMSFGKAFSKNKQLVDEAVKYAQSKDVLIIQAAGNDSEDIDISPNFPSKYYWNDADSIIGQAEAWITVGATSWELDENLIANFSNYGYKNVDVFAPGVAIYSTLPQSEYKAMDGTSMAAPVVAGLASLIRSYYPEFSAKETKQIILSSVEVIDKKVKITTPDRLEQEVYLAEISATGGIVNAYKAILEADKLRSAKKLN